MSDFAFNVIGGIGQISVNEDESDRLKMKISRDDENKYELCVTFMKTNRILYWKFFVENTLYYSKTRDGLLEATYKDEVIVSLWKVLYLPFEIREFFISKKMFCVQYQNFYADLYKQICTICGKNHLKESMKCENDFMDIDKICEFEDDSEFKIPKIPQKLMHMLPSKTLCIKCDLFNDSIVFCFKDNLIKSWNFELIYPLASGKRQLKKLPSLALTYKTETNVLAEDDTRKHLPIISFIDGTLLSNVHLEQAHSIVKKLLDTDPSFSSNCICLMGHPEGLVHFYLCSKQMPQQSLKVNTLLTELYNINQPVIGINFHEEMKGIGGQGYLFIIGAFGKLTILTADKLWKDSNKTSISSFPFFSSTFHLQSSIQKHILFKNYMFWISKDFKLHVSKFFTQTNVNSKRRHLHFGDTTLVMNDVLDAIQINETGLLLILTKQGSLYMSKYSENKSRTTKHTSLPMLTNKIMCQNASLHNLSTISRDQTLFFKALSIFASFKYKGSHKMEILCSITELDESLRKFVINVTVKGPGEMEDKYWCVTLSLRSHFYADTALSKTAPFINGHNLRMEIQMSLLCLSYLSPFPLFLEVGLLLLWPDCCFDFLKKQLPLYTCIQTFILNELYFLRCMLSHHHYINSEQSVLSRIGVNKKRSISKFFVTHVKVNFSNFCPYGFNFSLLQSFVKERRRCSSGGGGDGSSSHIIDNIFHSLGSRSNLGNLSNVNSLMCKNQPITLSATRVKDKICISIQTQDFSLLTGLRMAVTEQLLNEKNRISGNDQYIAISASLKEACEKLSKDFSSMVDRNVESVELMSELTSKYSELRSKVSSVLPFC